MILEKIPSSEYKAEKNYMSFRKYIGTDGGNSLVFKATQGDKEVGVSALEVHEKSATLRYITIDEKLRGKGLLNEFLTDILFELYEHGYTEFNVSFLPSENPALFSSVKRIFPDYKTSSRAFYRFKLKDVAEAKGKSRTSKSIVSFLKLTGAQVKELRKDIYSGGNLNLPTYDPTESPRLSNDLSIAHVVDGRVDGAIFIDMDKSGSVYLSYLWSDSEDILVFNDLVMSAIANAEGKITDDTEIEFAVTDRIMAEYLEKIFELKGENQVEVNLKLADLSLYEDDDE